MGGATNKLPGISDDMTLEEFEEQWDVFYITAHGALLTKNIIVPEDTYILNTVPSLSACRLKRTDPRLNRFYEDAYQTNFMNFIKNPKELVESLYNKTDIIPYIFQPNLQESTPKTSIYEPADNIHDIILRFKSHMVPLKNRATRGHTHFAATGIFKLPISRETKILKNKHFRDIGIASLLRSEINEGTKSRLKAAGIAVNKKLTNDEMTSKLALANREYQSQPDNLISKIIGNSSQTDFKLSALMAHPELQASPGKKRLIIVHTCKRAHGINNATAKRIRAESRGRIVASAAQRLNLLGQFQAARAKLNENKE